MTPPPRLKFVPVMTAGVEAAVSEELRGRMWDMAVERLTAKTDFVVFDPEARSEKREDRGRTVRVPFPDLARRVPVYVRVDDFGSEERLSEQLGRPAGTRYLATMLFSDEY